MTEMNNLDFYRSIPLLVSNIDRILSDPRMAFAKVPSGRILGSYLQWWKEYPVESHDYNGNPLVAVHGNWYSGSGYNLCYSVDNNGEKKKVMVYYWKKSWRTLRDIDEQWKNATPPDDTYSFEEVIDILTTTGDEGLNRYISILRRNLESSLQTIVDQKYAIESFESQIEVMRILRIEDMAIIHKDELRVDFEKLDAILKNFNRANTHYYTEKKCMRKAGYNGESQSEDSKRRLQEMKQLRDDLQRQVKEIEQTMVERYNPSVMYIQPMTIGELRNAYQRATRNKD